VKRMLLSVAMLLFPAVVSAQVWVRLPDGRLQLTTDFAASGVFEYRTVPLATVS
jgi:hypothetical protein